MSDNFVVKNSLATVRLLLKDPECTRLVLDITKS